MASPQFARWKRFLLGGALALVHSLFALYIVVAVFRSSVPGAIDAFAVFGLTDWPILPLCPPDIIGSITGICLFGGILWFCYGFTIQSLLAIRRLTDLPRFVIAALCVGFLLAIPELFLRSQPTWKQQWDRASALDLDQEKYNSDQAINYVKEAIRLSPKDNPMLPGMWDYVGNLYDTRNNYPAAEAAYEKSLSLIQAEPTPNPQDLLNAYNELAIFYRHSRSCLYERCAHSYFQ